MGPGKPRTPSACPAAAAGRPPGPRLTSGSDQGHNVLASGQGLAAGRRGLEAGRSEGERRGGREQERETNRQRDREFERQRLREVKKRNTEPERGKPEGGRERDPKREKGKLRWKMRDTEIQENTNRKLFRESQGPGAGVGLGGETNRQTEENRGGGAEAMARGMGLSASWGDPRPGLGCGSAPVGW